MKIQPLLERVTATIKGYVDRRVGELDAVLKALPTPRDGKDGIDGRTPTADELKSIIEPLIPAPIAGEKGLDGKDGRDGVDGRTPTLEEIKALIPQVKDGRDGVDGKSVTLEDVIPVIEQAVKAIPIPKDGKDGVNGHTPSADEIKSLIPAPIPGERGADGIDGRNGKDGTDGRDGLDITPIPAIDEAKSYPRGTYATHLSGLWRSFEQTNGMKGWECIVRGLHDIEEEMIDSRTIVTRYITSTGVIEKKRTTHSLEYKELWQKPGTYVRGDTVTWGGSMWVRIADGENKQPGTDGSGWRLAVRAGRDGDKP